MDTDTALANRLARDVDAAFPDLVIAHQDRLYTIALRLLGDRRDAEEVAQDALVRAYRAIGGYPRERVVALRLRPWLASIAVNLARNRRRRFEDRQPPNQLEPMVDAGFDPASDDGRGAPALAADRRETQRELASALLLLSPAVRVAIVLRHVDGLSVAECAEALDRPEGTIKAQVHRGLKELRALLEAPLDADAASDPPTTDHRSIARAASPQPAMEAIR
ncbi:MAG TPA: sigma-70 family RNA polymerase sigma factor [Candidatus Limnocylindrales bacterium]|nr:sigma-70 family RNA polymerase sigma factor [Candidatus Limnocylindrales bacterium]